VIINFIATILQSWAASEGAIISNVEHTLTNTV